MSPTLKLCTVAVVLAAGGICLAAETQPFPIAIKGAHIVTVSGQEYAKGTVLLREGLIEAVGEDIAVPADAAVIDGSGLTVYPGFIDAVSTWGIPQPAPVAGGRSTTGANATPTPAPATTERGTTERIKGPEDHPQMYSAERAADLIALSDSRLAWARAAGFTSANTYPNRGIFEGQGALINLAGERGRDMVIAQPTGQLIAFRVGGGGMGRAFPSSLMGNISYVRQMYLDLAQYQGAKKTYDLHPAGMRRPEYDRDLEGLAQSPLILLPATEVQQIDRMVSFGQELKAPFGLYGLHEGFERVDELKKAGVPLIISLKWPEKPKDADPAEVPNYRDLVLREKAPALPGMLAKAGVKFAFSSVGIENAPDLKKALKKAIDAGLDRKDAARALTLTPAEVCNAADRLGSIDKGKIANLTVTKGDAFDDNSTVEYVFIDGVQFQPSKDLQRPAKPGDGRGTGAKPTTAEEDEVKGAVKE